MENVTDRRPGGFLDMNSNEDDVCFRLLYCDIVNYLHVMQLILNLREEESHNYNALLSKMNQLDHYRLRRLQRAAEAGELIRAKQGVFESNSCSFCGFHHKISFLTEYQPPCPGTETGVKYYNTHKEEREALESFVLNKGLKTGEVNRPESKRQRGVVQGAKDVALPKIPKPGRTSPVIPRTATKAKPPPPTPPVGRSKAPKEQNLVSNNRTLKSPIHEPPPGKKAATGNGTCRHGYTHHTPIEGELCHTEPEKTEDVVGTRRQMVREMFIQEEEALRTRLAKEREKYQQKLK
jgi:hypothetical protein